MNRYLAAFIAYYGVIRERITHPYDHNDWTTRCTATYTEYQHAYTCLLNDAYPLAAKAIKFGSN